VSPLEIAVLGAATALAAGQLWLYWSGRRTPFGATGSHVQEFHVRVRGGFQPNTFVVEVGRPVRLVFHRDEIVSRNDHVVFDRPVIDQILPAFQSTTVEFTPKAPGDYRFRCGREAFGVVVATEPAETARTNLGRGHTRHA